VEVKEDRTRIKVRGMSENQVNSEACKVQQSNMIRN
jgi:hypothetical protein